MSHVAKQSKHGRFGVGFWVGTCGLLISCGGGGDSLEFGGIPGLDGSTAGDGAQSMADGAAATPDGSTGSTSDSGGAGGSTVSGDSTTSDALTANDGGASDAAADGLGSNDTGPSDAAVSGDSTTSDALASNDAAADAPLVLNDAGCPILQLGGATENVYVDKGVATTGTGTIQCPFKTILEATTIAAPGATTSRTIHVKGGAAPDYNETAPIFVRARVTLTSDYDAANPGGVALVRIVARGDCGAFTGNAANTFCSVAMDNNARLEKVTVRVNTLGAPTTGNGILTASSLPAAGAPPTIVDTLAENAPEAGIRVAGSAVIGPRVSSIGNRQGLTANRAISAANAQATIVVHDAPGLNGVPSNNFSSNTNNGGGNGFSVFGDYVVTIEGATASNNTFNGIVIGTPYAAATTVKHNIGNIHADNNGQSGMRIIGGEVHVLAGAVVNTFNGNKNAYGIEATTGDAIGNVKLVLEPQRDPGSGSYTIAHQANSNHLGGIRLNNATPTPATSAHQIASLEAKTNGSAVTGSGIFVEIISAGSPNQSSLELRGSTLLGNTGAGLRFQKGNTNTLDLGTAGTGVARGFNIWGDVTAANRNTKSAICYENVAAILAPAQLAEYDRWSQACVLPLGTAAFQGPLGPNGCGSNASYVEITYTGATAPIPAVTACY